MTMNSLSKTKGLIKRGAKSALKEAAEIIEKPATLAGRKTGVDIKIARTAKKIIGES